MYMYTKATKLISLRKISSFAVSTFLEVWSSTCRGRWGGDFGVETQYLGTGWKCGAQRVFLVRFQRLWLWFNNLSRQLSCFAVDVFVYRYESWRASRLFSFAGKTLELFLQCIDRKCILHRRLWRLARWSINESKHKWRKQANRF